MPKLDPKAANDQQPDGHRGSYKQVERVFLVLSLFYFTYIVSGFLVQPDWGAVARAEALGVLAQAINASSASG